MFDKPSIYFIMGTANSKGKDPLVLLKEALEGGISHFQLREKGQDALRGESLVNFALECQKLCTAYGVPFIINDDIELAKKIGADGVHVGQDDMDCASVRSFIGPDKLLGVSVHSIEEAELAIRDGADYLGMGPVYGTKSKDDAKPPAGVDKINEVIHRHPDVPIIGIGGITSDNAVQVWQAGVAGVAVISALADASDVQAEVEKFKNSYRMGQLI